MILGKFYLVISTHDEVIIKVSLSTTQKYVDEPIAEPTNVWNLKRLKL